MFRLVTNPILNFEHHKLLNSPEERNKGPNLPPTPEQQNAELEQLKEIVVELIDYKLREKTR